MSETIMRNRLPADVVAYKTTPEFTPSTVPAALLAMHRTKNGVWGRIEVLEGGLAVSWFDETGVPAGKDLLEAGGQAVVAPEQPHAVAFTREGRFTVTFFKAPKGAAIPTGGV